MAMISQSIELSAASPGTTWRQDVALEAPELRFPIDGARYCPPVFRYYGLSAGIELTWDAVAGATFYVVQLCADQSFRGSTVQGIRVTSTSYTLTYIENISVAQRIYWRVCAYSTGGGSSPNSKTRLVALECEGAAGVDYELESPSGSPNDPKVCDKAGVDIVIEGPDTVRKSESEREWALHINFDCKAFDNQAVTFVSADWEIKQSNTNPVTIESSDDTLLVLSIDATRAQSFEIEVTVTFNLTTDGDFTCNARKRVMIEGVGGGGSSETIHFEITDFHCEDLDDHGHAFATAIVTHVSCGMTGTQVGDEIEVYDLMGCWLTDAENLMAGRMGTASKMEHERYGGDGCDWSIIALCGSEVSC